MSTGTKLQQELEAIITMPGLPAMAGQLTEFGLSEAQAHSMLILIAGQWASSSRSELSAELQRGTLWTSLRRAAELSGHNLTEMPPTSEQFHNFLQHCRRLAGTTDGTSVGKKLAATLPTAWAELTGAEQTSTRGIDTCGTSEQTRTDTATLISVSLAARHQVAERGHPRHKNTAPAGSLFAAGDHSRRTHSDGAPTHATFCTVRGENPDTHYVVAVDVHDGVDRAEREMVLFEQVVAVQGHTIRTAFFDEPVSGTDQQWMMHCEILPVAPVQGAGKDRGMAAPAGKGHALALTPQAGMQAVRVTFAPLDTLTHQTVAGRCSHHLFAVGGDIVCLAAGELTPSWDSPALEQTGLQFDTAEDRTELVGRYRVPCRHQPFEFDFVLSGDRVGARDQLRPVADIVRPQPGTQTGPLLHAATAACIQMLRPIIRRCGHRGRAHATSDGTLIDLVGAAVHRNAVTWNSQRTAVARQGNDCEPATILVTGR